MIYLKYLIVRKLYSTLDQNYAYSTKSIQKNKNRRNFGKRNTKTGSLKIAYAGYA